GRARRQLLVRPRELLQCLHCRLEIPREQVKVLDHPRLQDGFHEKWDHGLLAELTMEHVQLWAIDTIV
ncbi:unnamed protein product, partial [Urochloa humidicola]